MVDVGHDVNSAAIDHHSLIFSKLDWTGEVSRGRTTRRMGFIPVIAEHPHSSLRGAPEFAIGRSDTSSSLRGALDVERSVVDNATRQSRPRMSYRSLPTASKLPCCRLSIFYGLGSDTAYAALRQCRNPPRNDERSGLAGDCRVGLTCSAMTNLNTPRNDGQPHSSLRGALDAESRSFGTERTTRRGNPRPRLHQ
jgi:hypothetical protein